MCPWCRVYYIFQEFQKKNFVESTTYLFITKQQINFHQSMEKWEEHFKFKPSLEQCCSWRQSRPLLHKISARCKGFHDQHRNHSSTAHQFPHQGSSNPHEDLQNQPLESKTHHRKCPSTGSLLAWRKAHPCCA